MCSHHLNQMCFRQEPRNREVSDISAILLCCHKKESTNVMESFLKDNGYDDVIVVSDTNSAQKQIANHSFAMILVDLPFTQNRHEVSFLLSLSKATNANIMAIVNKANYESLRDQVERFGIFTLCKPIPQELFIQLLAFMRVIQCRNHQILQKQKQLVDYIKEIKLVDRAKCLMIEYEYMSEEEAHKRIEKEAMNERVTRGVIAQRIIKQFEK